MQIRMMRSVGLPDRIETSRRTPGLVYKIQTRVEISMFMIRPEAR